LRFEIRCPRCGLPMPQRIELLGIVGYQCRRCGFTVIINTLKGIVFSYVDLKTRQRLSTLLEEKMRPRTVNIVVSVSGMTMPLATVTIQKFADFLVPETELVCPKCNQKPSWKGEYICSCGQHYRHWSMLKRVVKATGEEIVKEKFTDGKSPVVAQAYMMELEEFVKYVDATCNEYGIVVKDETSARNLKKLLIATKNLGKVVLIRFKDTYEERVAVLTLSLSNRIILRELIPLNLANIKETMRVDLKEVSEQELEEAEAFVKMLPPAKEELLNVSDYRTVGISEKKAPPKVIELEQIIQRAKAKKA